MRETISKGNVTQKRNNIFLLLTLLVLTLIIRFLYGPNPSISVFRNWVPFSGITIVIDPGHGGIDGGTNYQKILEKDINLNVSLKLKRLLEKDGANVVMTRAKDIALDHLNKKSDYRHKRDLIARTDIVNNTCPDIFVSVHVNAEKSSQKTSGPMVLYYSQSEQSKKLANFVQKRIEESYISSGYHISPRKPVANNSLFLLKNTKFPGIIIELGFITNSRDRSILTSEDFQKRLSEAIALGLKDYFQ